MTRDEIIQDALMAVTPNTGVTPAEVMSRSKKRNVSFVRAKMAVYIHEKHGLRQSQIARLLGYDHTSIHHMFRRVKNAKT